MDQFTVPKFIEHEAKIVGPLTFKQFIYIGIAAAICFILYFTAPFFVFILCTIVIMLAGVALAFLKASGRSLPTILKHFFTFSTSPKMYLWKKKGSLPPRIIEKAPPIKEEETIVPSAGNKGHLQSLATQIETKTKEPE